MEYQPTKIPEWLDNLMCGSSLLDFAELKFIRDIYSRIVQKGGNKTTDYNIIQTKRSVNSLRTDFKLVVEKLKDSTSKKRFHDFYPEWRNSRDSNVKQLKLIANKIDADRKQYQENKINWSYASLIGGGVCLLLGGGAIRLIGAAVMGLSSVGTAMTAAAEEVTLEESIAKAKKITEMDEQALKLLLKFLDGVMSLQEAIDKINSNCNRKFQTAAERFQDIFKRNLPGKQTENEIQMIIKSLPFCTDLKKEIADTVGILLAVCMLLQRYQTTIFKLAIWGKRLQSQLCLAVDIGRAAYNVMNSVAVMKNCGQLQKKQIGKGMVIDAINILIIAAQDLKSVEAKKIREVAAELDNEAKEFDKLYQEMKSGYKFKDLS